MENHIYGFAKTCLRRQIRHFQSQMSLKTDDTHRPLEADPSIEVFSFIVLWTRLTTAHQLVSLPSTWRAKYCCYVNAQFTSIRESRKHRKAYIRNSNKQQWRFLKDIKNNSCDQKMSINSITSGTDMWKHLQRHDLSNLNSHWIYVIISPSASHLFQYNLTQNVLKYCQCMFKITSKNFSHHRK